MQNLLRIGNKFKWWFHVVSRSILRVKPYFAVKIVKLFSGQIVFRDASGFLLNDISSSDLQYSTKHEGFFFDCHDIREYLQTSSTPMKLAIDVGANLGAISFLLSKKSNSVIAFEPTKSTFTRLENNLKLNQINNVQLESLACSSTSGFSLLHKNGYHGHSSLSPRDDLKQNEKVRTIRLEEYLDQKSIKKVDFLKIDVEGYELSVLQGLGRFLNPKLCQIIVWEHSKFTDLTSGNSLLIYELLTNAGYSIRDLRGNLILPDVLVKSDHMDVLSV